MNHNDYHFVLGNLEAIDLLPHGFDELQDHLYHRMVPVGTFIFVELKKQLTQARHLNKYHHFIRRNGPHSIGRPMMPHTSYLHLNDAPPRHTTITQVLAITKTAVPLFDHVKSISADEVNTMREVHRQVGRMKNHLERLVNEFGISHPGVHISALYNDRHRDNDDNRLTVTNFHDATDLNAKLAVGRHAGFGPVTS